MSKSLRWLVVVAAWGATCGGFEHDPGQIVRELAGPDAVDCGESYDGDNAVAMGLYRCAINSLAAQEPFFVLVGPPSSDGGTITGYASDGVKTWRIVYDYVIGIGCPLGDEESLSRHACESIQDRGVNCSDLHENLCLVCVNPSEVNE